MISLDYPGSVRWQQVCSALLCTNKFCALGLTQFTLRMWSYHFLEPFLTKATSLVTYSTGAAGDLGFGFVVL